MAGYAADEGKVFQMLLESSNEANHHLQFCSEKLSHIEVRTCIHSCHGAAHMWREMLQNHVVFEVSLWKLVREKMESIKFFVGFLKTPATMKFLEKLKKDTLVEKELVKFAMDSLQQYVLAAWTSLQRINGEKIHAAVAGFEVYKTKSPMQIGLEGKMVDAHLQVLQNVKDSEDLLERVDSCF